MSIIPLHHSTAHPSLVTRPLLYRLIVASRILNSLREKEYVEINESLSDMVNID